MVIFSVFKPMKSRSPLWRCVTCALVVAPILWLNKLAVAPNDRRLKPNNREHKCISKESENETFYLSYG